MKLTNVTTFAVANPPPSFGGRWFLFVRIETHEGGVGYGEAYGVPFRAPVAETMVADVFDRILAGKDPRHIERIWREAYAAGFSVRPDPSVMGIVSALEMACWDLVGKEVGQPVHQLLGGRLHDRLRAYTYLYPEPTDQGDAVYVDPSLAAERAVEMLELGFDAVKFDPAGAYSPLVPRQPSMDDLDRSDAFCSQIRAAVGPRADLLFGTHGQFTPSGALRMARRLEPHDPLWFEEPVPPDRPEAMARVASGTCIPIAAGERLTTKYEFARLLELGAASILQLNLGRVGGLLEAKKIAGMAEAFHAEIAPHLYCGPIVGAANVQLAATLPNFCILESIKDWSGFHAEILRHPIEVEDGHVIVPTAPGLGVELDEGVARANPYAGDRLPLEPHSIESERSDPSGIGPR